jgi:hypothetical protein
VRELLYVLDHNRARDILAGDIDEERAAGGRRLDLILLSTRGRRYRRHLLASAQWADAGVPCADVHWPSAEEQGRGGLGASDYIKCLQCCARRGGKSSWNWHLHKAGCAAPLRYHCSRCNTSTAPAYKRWKSITMPSWLLARRVLPFDIDDATVDAQPPGRRVFGVPLAELRISGHHHHLGSHR